MKVALCIIAVLIAVRLPAQQAEANRFIVVEEETAEPIPFVSVTLTRANLSIHTESDGVFSIPGDLSNMSDTLIINAQNYIELRLPLSQLQGISLLVLKRSVFKPREAKRTLKRDTLLNNFTRRDITHYAGVQMVSPAEPYLQLAQQFHPGEAGILLKNITVCRLAFIFHYHGGSFGMHDYVGLEYTRFRIRIYGVDKKTGGPGADLTERIIEFRNKEDWQMRVNLENDRIVIPDSTFFVAVEWLRNFENSGYATVRDTKTGLYKLEANYRPAIGISPIKTGKLNMWAMNFKREWVPYADFSPYFTDLAIKATVIK